MRSTYSGNFLRTSWKKERLDNPETIASLMLGSVYRYESQNVQEDISNVVIASYDQNNQVENIPENLFIRLWDLTSGCQHRWYYKETTYPIGQVNLKT